MLQEASGVTVAHGMLVTAKSEAFVPLIAALVMITELVPLLKIETLAFTGEPETVLPRSTDAGTVSASDEVCPTPDSPTDWGLPVALSATWREAVRSLAADGVKTRFTSQMASGASTAPQVVEATVKSVGLAPANE